jgi:hypothetical protein
MLRELAILPTLLALGCSSSVELSALPHLTASSDPTVLAVVNERVRTLAVDDRRIYWLGSVDGEGLDAGTLHSCEKQACVGSLLTYGAAGRTFLRLPVGLAGGQVYWWELGADNLGALNACDVSGCEHGVRTVAAHVADITAAAFSADYAYVVVAPPRGVLRIPLAGNDNDAQPEQLFARGALDILSIAVQSDYLYGQGLGGNASVERARVDGSGEVEVLADHLGIDNSASLTLDASHVYWSDDALSGSIVRCPLAGCAGAPESLVVPIRLPTALQVDGPNLYWEQDTTASGAVISSCALTHCVPSEPIARGVDDMAVLAIDDEYLYTATTDQNFGPDWPNPSASIRRIRK